MGSTIEAVKVLDHYAELELNGNDVNLTIDTSKIGSYTSTDVITSINIEFNSLSSGATATSDDSTTINNITNGKLQLLYTNGINLNANLNDTTISVMLCTIVDGGDNYSILSGEDTNILINNSITICTIPRNINTRWDKLKIN